MVNQMLIFLRGLRTLQFLDFLFSRYFNDEIKF